ncbi:hypothetical protein [Fluviicola sp.]|uniref:hypothetical protein n=1 Tax=Fluviicola sp. TaxID=1917219 RepID=UPI003D29E995
MKHSVLILILLDFFLATNAAFAQRKIESPKTIVLEQEGDSVFCKEKETRFEVLDFEFDSCNFSNNRFFLTFLFVNRTEYVVFLNPTYISWYDTNSLRPKDYNIQAVKSGQSIVVTLESIPYAKKRMNSPGQLHIRYEEKELEIPIRLKQESSKVIYCREGEELRK